MLWYININYKIFNSSFSDFFFWKANKKGKKYNFKKEFILQCFSNMSNHLLFTDKKKLYS